ncbi:hypothetical protein TFLX_06198 [Thermoflexales bacterium]|nr:hypothetical protein TFLX_06198 [Thermoflexales bacterium]
MNISFDAPVPLQAEPLESSAETLIFSVQYESADHLQARVLYFPQTMLSWRFRIYGILFFGVITFMVAGDRLRGSAALLAMALFALAIPVMFILEWIPFIWLRWRLWFLSRFTLEWWIAQYHKSVHDVPQVATVVRKICGRDPDELLKQVEALGPHEFRFDDWGGYYITSTTRVGLAWAEYCRVLENERVFLLVYGRGWYWNIPKRALTFLGGPDVFRNFLQRRIKK